jgi:hypothetical protein
MIICLALVVVTLVENFKTSAVGLSMLGFGLLLYVFFIWDNMLYKIAWYRRAAYWINSNLMYPII